MNRPIKFRVWDALEEQMRPVEDMFFSHGGWTVTTGRDLDIDGKTAILMQFTGLHDAEGKEIYEGDVVKMRGVGLDPKQTYHVQESDGSLSVIAVAEWGGDFFGLNYGYGPKPIRNIWIDEEDLGVIGNRFEHPRLIEPERAA